MGNIKKKATKQVRIYPAVHEKLRRLAFKRRKTIAAVIAELTESV